MRILVVGPQGAGKCTQAAILAAKWDLPHISTGDILRSHITDRTDLGVRSHRFVTAGQLVPDTLVSEMVARRLTEADASRGFLLDGFPRTTTQARWLTAVLKDHGHVVDTVLHFDVPDDLLTERMISRGRADDTPAAIATRLDLYRRETRPLLAHFSDIVVSVDGVGTVHDVHLRVRAALEQAATGAVPPPTHTRVEGSTTPAEADQHAT